MGMPQQKAPAVSWQLGALAIYCLRHAVHMSWSVSKVKSIIQPV